MNATDAKHHETLKNWLAIEKLSTFTNGKINDDYLNTYAEIYGIPVTKLVMKCLAKEFSVWIIGKNQTIFFDEMPNAITRLLGTITKPFTHNHH